MLRKPFDSPGPGPKQDKTARVRGIRSVPLDQWPPADQTAWSAACLPAARLKRGGAACHMKPVTREDLARRYGCFLDLVRRLNGHCRNTEAAGYVTPERVARYVDELKARVSSVTTYGSIYKLRRMAQLLAPGRDFTWLTEIEKDLAFVMQPRSKFDRLVWTEVLVEAGMTLLMEADAAVHRTSRARALQYRDGLMVALLALCPVRLKNFAGLELRRTFMQVEASWWIVLPASETKEGRADERQVPEFLTPWIDRYLGIHRPVLARTGVSNPFLWLSSTDGRTLTYSSVQRAIGAATLATVGIEVSPHLFRTSAASTAAIHGGSTPGLASALLHHTNPAVTDRYYNRAGSLTACQTYAALVKTFQHRD